jgi:signal transduction histidine kinase
VGLASLRFRLWLTYALLVGVVLCIIGVTLVVYLLSNPADTRLANQRLRLVSQVIGQRAQQTLSLLDNQPRSAGARLEQLVERADQAFGVRVALLDASGQVLADSRAAEAGPLPAELNLSDPPPAVLPTFRDASGRVWQYLARRQADQTDLLVASPRPVTPIFNILREEFVGPFSQAALIALFLALLLSVGMARWVAGPLQRMAFSARKAADGELAPIRPEGPQEVQELARAFNEMTRRVYASQTAQRDFVANVSHDLKTPLTSIQGFAQAILDGAVDSPEALRQAAGVIHAEAGRMTRMVQDLLDLARFDAGIAGLQRAPVELNEVLAHTLERFQPLARAGQVSLALEGGGLPVIAGDGDRLAQVFTNLVDNALKHTPPNGRVTIHASQVEGWVEVAVTDSGAGIPAEDLPRIFERFYQTDKSRQGGRGRGVGLGLAISREIVQAHGGTISAFSNPRQGSVFVVKLPVARPDDVTAARKTAPQR